LQRRFDFLSVCGDTHEVVSAQFRALGLVDPSLETIRDEAPNNRIFLGALIRHLSHYRNPDQGLVSGSTGDTERIELRRQLAAVGHLIFREFDFTETEGGGEDRCAYVGANT
jgi:hypothetical protein